MARQSPPSTPAPDADFERQMAIAREIMDKDWITLRALALGDQYPELDIASLLKMAEQEKRERDRQSGQG